MTVEQFNRVNLDSSYLDDYRNAIRSKTLPWDGFARSGLISPKDAASLTSLEKLSIGGKFEQSEFKEYAETIFGILNDKSLPIERTDVLKFNLVLLSDLLNVDGFVEVLIKDKLIETGLNSVKRHLENTDEIIKLLSIYDSVGLLINLDTKSLSANLVIDELLNLIKVRNFNLKFLSLNLISELLLNSHKQYRIEFWKKHKDLLPVLFQNLNEQFGTTRNNDISTNDLIQLQYKILLIIWILSFEKKELKTFNESYLNDLLSLLRILKISIKEKVIRLIISIFINLTSDEESTSSLEIVKFLILNGEFISILNNLKERKWSDDELITDLDVISEISSNIFDKLTSFDEYLQELTLKNFKNSPVHFKEEFFIDNLSRFQDSNYKIFKEMLDILDDNHQESLSLKLLLGDLEKILKIDSNSLAILIKTGKKTSIMQLLNHKNSDVRYQALKITQFLVSQSLK